MLCAWRTTRAGDPGPPEAGGLDPASLQSERLRTLVGRLLTAGGIQAERIRAAGVTAPDGITLADLPRLPMVAKADLWGAYPFGMIQVPAEDLVAVHGSS